MQNRYAGDVGDYIKLALLRTLAEGRRLGVAWYLYPDEQHNDDGKHVAYLRDERSWGDADRELFDALRMLVQANRSVAGLQAANVLHATYFDVPVPNGSVPPRFRSEARGAWFSNALSILSECDLVFADPDNGLTDDAHQRRTKGTFGKQIPLDEAKALAHGRAAIIYHHNTRFAGGHDLEVDHWLDQLGNAVAIRANAFSCRTFFLVNPDDKLLERAREFCARWANHRVWLTEPRGGRLSRAA